MIDSWYRGSFRKIARGLILCLLMLGCAKAMAVDYCEYGKKTALLFVDRTTEYDQTDHNDLETAMNLFWESLEAGDYFALHTISDDPLASRPLYSACYARCPEMGLLEELMSACMAIPTREERLKQRYDMGSLLTDLINEPEVYSKSEIARTAVKVISEYSARADTGEIPKVELVQIYSDLLENSPLLPTTALLEWQPKQSIRHFLERGGIPEFHGSDVVVYGVGRSHGPDRHSLSFEQIDRVVDVWTEVFKMGNAGTVRVETNHVGSLGHIR